MQGWEEGQIKRTILKKNTKKVDENLQGDRVREQKRQKKNNVI